MGAFSRRGADLIIAVRLTPRAAVDRIDGLSALADGSTVVLARVRAVAEDGKANAALLGLIAARLSVAKSAVSLISGATGRLKRVAVAGCGALDDAAILARLIGVRHPSN